jgi:3',5'-cyclic AMP phosphodiesterase CpdA
VNTTWLRTSALWVTVVFGGLTSVGASPPLIERSLENLRQRPLASPDAFDFIVTGDSNTLKPLEQSELFRQMIREFNILKPNFVVEVGDLILGGAAQGVPPQWDVFHAVIRDCKPPYFALPGNHDISDAATEQMWRDRMGPTHYAFSHGNSLFILLNSEELGAVGRIAAEQTAWVKTQLASTRAKNVFVFLHQPHFEHQGDPDSAAESWQKHWANMADVFRGHPVRVVFAGHRHGYRDCGTHEGVRYVICGGAATYGMSGRPEEGAINHYLWVRVRGEDVSWAVIKPNAVLPENVVTSARLDELYNVRNKWVNADELCVPLGQPIDRNLRITVKNPGTTSIRSTLSWDSKPGWSVSPQKADYEPASNDATALTFHVRVDKPEDVRFPVPVFRTRYPQTQHGPAVDVEQDLKLVPTISAARTRQRIVIDGLLDEWKTAQMAPLTYAVGFDAKDTSDLQCRLGFLWDDDNLYMAVETHDNEFCQPYAGDIVWLADSVEMFLDAWSWAFSLTRHGPEVFCYWGVDAPGNTVSHDVKLVVKRNGSEVTYEAAFPKSQLTPLKLVAGNSLRFNALMNDLDPSGPQKARHWLQLVPEAGTPGSRPPRVKVVLMP